MGSMAFGFMAFKQNATDNCPDDRGVCASLSGAVNWEEFAVRVEVVRYSEHSLEFILSFFEGACVNEDYVSMKSVAASEEACERWYYYVVTGCGIVVKFDE